MTTVVLPAICDRAAARSVHLELVEAVGDTPVKVDASAVDRVGQAMLQLLVSASGTESGISLTSPSQLFVNAICLAGLEPSLGADIEGPVTTPAPTTAQAPTTPQAPTTTQANAV